VVTYVDPEAAPRVPRGSGVLVVDGRPPREALAAAEELISGATPQWLRARALNRLTWGAKDEAVRLQIQPPGEPPRTVELRRTFSPEEADRLWEPRPEKVAELRPGIFYLDLSRITDEDFAGALERLAAAKGIVFDLRGYPNVSTAVLAHLTDTAINSAQWLRPVVTRPDRQEMTFKRSGWTVEPRAPRLTAKAAFLTDGRAISYAETYLGIVEHYKLAEIVGGPTAGTNGNVNPFTLPGSYWISWTGMKVLKHDGSRHHGVGILPTVPAGRTLRGVAEGRDEVLEKGIEVVSGDGSGS
jgi:C-terminal processing protease CtpA/Prc